MPKILHAIAETAFSEIVESGFALKIRRIRSSDLAEVGVAALQMVPSAFNGKKDADPDPDPVGSGSVTPAQMKKISGYQEAVVCAALVEIGDPETGEWERVSVVMDAKRQNPDKSILWIGSLPQQIVAAVFSEAIRLTTEKEVAARRLAAFRGRTQITSAS